MEFSSLLATTLSVKILDMKGYFKQSTEIYIILKVAPLMYKNKGSLVILITTTNWLQKFKAIAPLHFKKQKKNLTETSLHNPQWKSVSK